MVSAMPLRAEHRIEAGKGDVRGDQEDGGGERDADGGGNLLALEPQNQAHGGADQQRQRGQRGRQPQRGKGGCGQVEEVGHGKRVIAHAAMRQQRANVVDKGQKARVPQSPAQHRGGEHADDGERSLRAGEPCVVSREL